MRTPEFRCSDASFRLYVQGRPLLVGFKFALFLLCGFFFVLFCFVLFFVFFFQTLGIYQRFSVFCLSARICELYRQLMQPYHASHV
ncbi:hypothetical protein LEMLEM_LOCUS16324 [Lemmus lemmus]